MAVLIDSDRVDIWARFMRDLGRLGLGSTSFTKADLRAAIDSADAWADANASSYNSALPLPFRSAARAKQKAAVLQYVIAKRFDRS